MWNLRNKTKLRLRERTVHDCQGAEGLWMVVVMKSIYKISHRGGNAQHGEYSQ